MSIPLLEVATFDLPEHFEASQKLYWVYDIGGCLYKWGVFVQSLVPFIYVLFSQNKSNHAGIPVCTQD